MEQKPKRVDLSGAGGTGDVRATDCRDGAVDRVACSSSPTVRNVACAAAERGVAAVDCSAEPSL